jgi:hypothetical protein
MARNFLISSPLLRCVEGITHIRPVIPVLVYLNKSNTIPDLHALSVSKSAAILTARKRVNLLVLFS